MTEQANNVHLATSNHQATAGLNGSQSHTIQSLIREGSSRKSLVRILHMALREAGENPHLYSGNTLTAFLVDIQNILEMIEPTDEQATISR